MSGHGAWRSPSPRISFTNPTAKKGLRGAPFFWLFETIASLSKPAVVAIAVVADIGIRVRIIAVVTFEAAADMP